MPDEVNAAGQGAEGTGSAVSSTAGSTGGTGSVAPADNWESRFTGLQGKHQQTVEAFKVKETGLIAQVDQLNATVIAKTQEASDLSKAVEELNGKYTGSTKTLAERDATLEELNAKLERQTLIMGEFPDLAMFEVKGLLPKDKAGEDLRKGLAEFRSMLAATGEDALKRKSAGFTTDGDHASGARNQTMTLADVQSKQMEANAKGDWKESKRLEDLAISMQDAQAKKS